MKRDLISSAVGIVVLTVLLGLLYPLIVTGISQLAFPGNANGQRVYYHGHLVGSELIGQQFADQQRRDGRPEVRNGNPVTAPDRAYFQTRPSATVVANATIQAHRVAIVRHLSLADVDGLIARFTGGRGLGFSGEPGVNVLELNLALDRLTGRTP